MAQSIFVGTVYCLLLTVLLRLHGSEATIVPVKPTTNDSTPGSTMTCKEGTTAILCDGIQECDQAMDERFCMRCTETGFKCKGDSMCVPKSERCNNRSFCEDRSDEEDCKPSGN